MDSLYSRLRKGEVLRVQFAGQPAWGHKGPFTVQRLLMLGDFSVTEESEWARFAHVGGIIVNRRRKERMDQAEMLEWCELLEEVL